MRITKLLFVETGTYNDMGLRPYRTNLDARDVSVYQELSDNGQNFSAEALSGVASRILRPDATVRGPALIDNGWGERRLRFLLEIEEEAFHGSKMILVITGYTNYTGVSHGGAIDPDMRLFFNNSLSIRENLIMTPVGRQSALAVADASHVIPRFNINNHQAAGNINDFCTHVLRPEDVVKTMLTASLRDPDLIDTRTLPISGPRKSRRNNGNPSMYLSRTMKALDSASKTNTEFEGYDEVNERAASLLKEQPIFNDKFLGDLLHKTEYNYDNFITWGTLCAIYPEADHVSTVFLKGEVQRNAMSNRDILAERGMTEHWAGSNIETVAATMLSQSIPAIMMELMITRVVFAATNETLDGMFAVELRDASSFSKNIDMSQYMQSFIDRLRAEVLNDVSHCNQLTVRLSMSVDVMGDTFISIAMNGGPSVDYTMPSFCDVLFAPVVGSNAENLNIIAHDIESLYTNSTGVNYHDVNRSWGNEHIDNEPMGARNGKLISTI